MLRDSRGYRLASGNPNVGDRIDDAFTRRLDKAGFKAEQVTVRARSNGKGPRHTIWFAIPR